MPRNRNVNGKIDSMSAERKGELESTVVAPQVTKVILGPEHRKPETWDSGKVKH